LAAYKASSVVYIKRQIERYESDAADGSLPQIDRDAAKRVASDFRAQLSTASLGVPFTDFALSLADRPHISEILDRELSERHGEWRQELWKENRDGVAAHTEALIAQEVDSPLRTAVSTEASGLLELVYPGLEGLPLPASFEESLPNDRVRQRLAEAWPTRLAALLDSLRADRAVAWSKEQPSRKWNEESPLYERWSTRSKNGWTARRFIGEDDADRRRHTLQLRVWFAKTVLTAVEGPAQLSASPSTTSSRTHPSRKSI
jgi:hypothetical protein